MLDLRVEKFGEQLLALVDQHVRARPALASSVLRRLAVVNLRLLIRNHTDARIVELHPLTLALDDSVIVAELQTLTLVDHHALQVVDLGAALAVLHAELLGERYPKIQLLLHEGLRVDAEALEVDEEDFGVVTDHDLLGGNLARQTRLTHQLVVLVQQLLEAEPPHALD